MKRETVVGKPITLKELLELIKAAEDAKREGRDPQRAAMKSLLDLGPCTDEELNRRTENHPCNKEFAALQHPDNADPETTTK